MSADRLAACQPCDGLIDNRLKNRSRQILFFGTLVNQGLNIRLCEYTTTGRNGINHLISLCQLIQSCCICLQKTCHLVDKGACTTGTNTVHSLLYVAAFKIDNLGILAAKLNGNICLWCQLLQGSGYGDNLLYKRYFQMIGKCQSAGTGDDR